MDIDWTEMNNIFGVVVAVSTLIGIPTLIQIIRKIRRKGTTISENNSDHEPLHNDACQLIFPAPKNDYLTGDIFSIAGCRLNYFPIFGGSKWGDSEYRFGDIVVESIPNLYQIPARFLTPDVLTKQPMDSPGELKCRLTQFFQQRTPSNYPDLPHFCFSPATYRDYICTNHRLDDPCPGESGRSYRDLFGRDWVRARDFEASELSNVCGVGIFVITADNRIVITQHVPTLKVYPEAWSYSASGTMDWAYRRGADASPSNFDPNYVPNPFDDVRRECIEEIAHEPNIEQTYLMGFGIDANKLFIQFSFYEKTAKQFKEIEERAPTADHYAAEVGKLEGIPFDLDNIMTVLTDGRYWEPAAAANLLRLCEKQFGREAVEIKLNEKMVKKRAREKTIAEWEYNRAKRPRKLSRVMSNRYPTQMLDKLSSKYVSKVEQLIQKEIEDKDVLEIGCGIGRFTAFLNAHAKQVTCLDISPTMIETTKSTLPSDHRVVFKNEYIQDYKAKKRHDVALSSLVLVHITEDWDLEEAAQSIANSTDTILLFEHADESADPTSVSRPRSEDQLINAFGRWQFSVKEREPFLLNNDIIVFLKLSR